MISETKSIDNAVLDSLKRNHYSRRIKSHFYAYGTDYSFSRFFFVEDSKEIVGIISIFNSTMIVASVESKALSESMLDEISGFVRMNKPMTVECEYIYAEHLAERLNDEYSGDMRTEFDFIAKHKLPPMSVNELPRLDDVFDVLKTSFPAIADSYELWITDTSHRIRHGLSQSFLLNDCSTATIQYIIDDIALIGHVATVPQMRGKHYARHLLYWIGERLTQDGFKVKLYARPHRVSYYEEIGFKAIGTDTVLERKIK